MLEKGGFSFVALLVINPVVILLYQNCSFLPVSSQAEVASKEFSSPRRAISSVAEPTKVDLKMKVAQPSLSECAENKGACPTSTVE